MTTDFTSVTLFYVALRQALLVDAGFTIERTLGTHDLVLSGLGGFARLQMEVVSPTVSAVCLTLGTDPDELSVSSHDPELCLPFNTTVPERFYGLIELRADPALLTILIAPNSETPGTQNSLRCYRAEVDFGSRKILVTHENPPNNDFFPNFKVSGGPYIEAGV